MTTENLIPTVRTTPSKLDFALAVLKEWPDANKPNIGVLWAHFAGETGEGKYCWNWNLGNVKKVKGDGFNYVSLRGVWEGFKLKDLDGDGDIDDDDKQLLIDRLVKTGLWSRDDNRDHAIAVGKDKVSMIASVNNPASWFRAYDNLNVGMHFYINMKRNPASRYASAWPFIVGGMPKSYAYELGAKRYYTANRDVYARSMQKHFDKWMTDSAYDDAIFEMQETKRDLELANKPIIENSGAIVRTLRYPGLPWVDDNDEDDNS